MKKNVLLGLIISLLFSCGDDKSTSTETTQKKMPVNERLAKARAAKAAKKLTKSDQPIEPVKATPDDYQAPVVKQLKGPDGEEVHEGERGAKFYINKNGNKTYLSSNR